MNCFSTYRFRMVLVLLAILALAGCWIREGFVASSAEAAQQRFKQIDIDQKTGTRFSIKDEDDSLPMFSSCLGRGAGSLEVFGEVPSNISLADDALAENIVTKGVNAVKLACPNFQPTDHLSLKVMLFKGSYSAQQATPVVVAEWKSVIRENKAGYLNPENRKIVREYRNSEAQNAKEEAMIASGEIRPLPNNYFLFFVETDNSTGTNFWIYSQARSQRCWTWSGGIQDVFGEVPKSVSLLNDVLARSLIMRGELAAVNACAQPWLTRKVSLVPTGYKASAQGSYVNFNPVLVWAQVFRGYQGQQSPVINQYENTVVEAEKRRLQQVALAEKEAARQKRWNEFVRKTGVQEMINTDALRVNPFVYQGKTVAIHTHFERMLSPDTGKFGNIIVSGLPSDMFRSQGTVVLAGRVVGTTELKGRELGEPSQVPHLKFIGVHFCHDYSCSDLLK